MPKILRDNEEMILADKGYIGCENVITPLKKKKFPFSGDQIAFSIQEIKYNKLISHYRILVENINASIKQWNILSHVYRGSMEVHNKIFIVCCILINVSYYD